jgi:tetratricopeptide (TPR) repeat protein
MNGIFCAGDRKMRSVLILVSAAASLAACASTGDMQMVEQGYERGSLGVGAISREDWAAAERSLEQSSLPKDDPARLINLGRVYMAMGRRAEALSAWRLALASDKPVTVETMGGEAISTAELARRALAFYDTDVRTASAGTR